MTPIRVTYAVGGSAAEVRERAHAIAWEQSVEVPESVIVSQALRDAVVGRVEDISALCPQVHAVQIAYPGDHAEMPPSQLMNLVFGNISLLDTIRVLRIQLPHELSAYYDEPQFGCEGIRGVVGDGGVYDRPLLATALKPKGASTADLAGLAYGFALGGGDLVKDDHNLVDSRFDQYQRRVGACAEAVLRANEETGRRTLYLANLAGPSEELDERLAFLREVGAAGFLIAPFLVGLDRTQELARRYSLIAVSHPAWAGGFLGRTHGIAHDVLLGQLPRLLGLDASVFPNSGGRFGFTRGECLSIAERLLEPTEPSRRAAFPAPAGGMQLASVADMARDYGTEAMFLVGGALLQHSDDIRVSTRTFQQAIASHFGVAGA
ncbi:MAG: RuBisCO large subunit C-terminal-like domain-containing protein [Planctomycetota bacterium]